MIYFCAKNRKVEEAENAAEDDEESKDEVGAAATAEARAKRVSEGVKAGKVEIAKSKQERERGNELGTLQQ